MTTAMVRCHSSVNDLLVPLLKKNDEIRINIKASASTCVKITSVSWQDVFAEKVEKASCVGSVDI
jgi:hypothetical protein